MMGNVFGNGGTICFPDVKKLIINIVSVEIKH